MPCVRRALSASNEPLCFEEDCQCPPPAVSLAQRIRSFAWLTKQHKSPLDFIIAINEAPPRLVSSLMRSCLFPSLSTITSFDLYLPRSLPSHPRLLFSLSQAPRLESLFIQHCGAADSESAAPNHQCNDPVMVAEMWEMVSIMEEKNPDDTARLFPVLCRLDLSLSACSPLVLCFVACLSSQLHSLDLAADDQFAAQEGEEGPEIGEDPRERDVDGRTPFSLHLPLATDVRLGCLKCSISLSASRLSSLKFRWQCRHSRLLLLPTCPTHLSSLFLTTDPTCPWALHAPHLTSLHSLCTDMDPEQVACFPPGVIETVKVLDGLSKRSWRRTRESRSGEQPQRDDIMWPFGSSDKQQALPLRHEGGRSYYDVQPGDNLTKIAGQLGSTVEILMQANALRSDLLHPGQSLWVPRTYTIAKGDTLYAIARMHGTTVDAIMQINNIQDANLIHADDIILLP
ncbi:unnamed protein product [Closterium sp. NIES-64]|nr:unnamed protein product [Closterium sp. NIES-64]